MPKIVTAADRQQKRQAILDAAAAEIARYGYDRANINTIAERAGIGRGTIYLYFESKEDVQDALLDTIGRVIDEAVEDCITRDLPWADRLEQLAEAFVTLADRHSDYFRVQLTALHGVNRVIGAPVLRWLHVTVDRLTNALEKAAADGVVVRLPAETLATFVVGTLESFVLLPGVLQQHDDLSRRAQILARILWQGMAPDHDGR